jgi:tetrahydromethanopterin S-methyltransferase subunit B
MSRAERFVDNGEYVISSENHKMIMNSIEELREKQDYLDSKIDSVIKALETREKN